MYDVAVVKYEKPFESLKKAVDLAGGLGNVSITSKVIIKPNFCLWHRKPDFPKYGVLTTSRLIEDAVVLLKEYGVKNIGIVEGIVNEEANSESLLQHAAKVLGLDKLGERYGVKIIDVHKGSFTEVTAGDVKLSINKDILEADYIVNMPALKTHSQVMVSLGIKNLKGVMKMASRKLCHNEDDNFGLDYHLSKLPEILSPSFTILDGIYTLEQGPLYSGVAHRSNIIIASKDLISSDKVGSTVLGFNPQAVPYIASAAKRNGRVTDLTDINLRGEADLKKVSQPHAWRLDMNASGEMPMILEIAGIKGITIREPDKSLCTYCALLYVYLVTAIMAAKNKFFDEIEILHGKINEPSGKHKHTVLAGQCQVKKNSKNPLIKHCVKINGCPPNVIDFLKAYNEVGIEMVDHSLRFVEGLPEFFMKKYKDNPEFDEAFYKIK